MVKNVRLLLVKNVRLFCILFPRPCQEELFHSGKGTIGNHLRHQEIPHGRDFEILSDYKSIHPPWHLQNCKDCQSCWEHMTTQFATNRVNADMLSHLPVDPAPTSVPEPMEHILLMEMLSTTPLTAAQIKQWSRRDSHNSQGYGLCLTWRAICQHTSIQTLLRQKGEIICPRWMFVMQ